MLVAAPAKDNPSLLISIVSDDDDTDNDADDDDTDNDADDDDTDNDAGDDDTDNDAGDDDTDNDADDDDDDLRQISAMCGGWVTDRIGRRPTLLIGSIIFSGGGVVLGAAPSKELLLVGRVVCGIGIGERSHTPNIAFRHLPPNSARFSYATEGALFISAQLSTDAVSAPRKVWVLITLWKQPSAQART